MCGSHAHVFFHMVHHARDMVNALQNYMEKRYTNVAVWIQSGSWDLKFKTTYHLFTDALPTYLTILKKFNRFGKSHAHFYVLTPPPHPFKFNVSNFDAASYSYHVRNLAEDYGIPLFDMFSAVLSCANDNVIGSRNHYWEADQGEIGRVYWFGHFLSSFCSRINPDLPQ